MSINPKKCSELSETVAARLHGSAHPTLAAEPEPLPLPPGFDASLFTPEQTEYISDLFVATVRDYLTRLDSLLEVTIPGVAPTAARIGCNWLTLRKLAGISCRAVSLPWRNVRIAASTNPYIFEEQRKAMFGALRAYSNQPFTTRQ